MISTPSAHGIQSPTKEGKLKKKYPVWLPDESVGGPHPLLHRSENQFLHPYSKIDGKWGGNGACGLGYGGYLSAKEEITYRQASKATTKRFCFTMGTKNSVKPPAGSPPRNCKPGYASFAVGVNNDVPERNSQPWSSE